MPRRGSVGDAERLQAIHESEEAMRDRAKGVEGGSAGYDLEELFPQQRRFPQKELVKAGERGLYDLVQKDSSVEERFVERLWGDKKVVFFFKFPLVFKVNLPKLIGNCNPDWGIVRYRREREGGPAPGAGDEGDGGPGCAAVPAGKAEGGVRAEAFCPDGDAVSCDHGGHAELVGG